MIGSDALLALALIAIYLVDSMHFMSIGEAVVITCRGVPIALSFGGRLELAGRRPYLPNPLTPHWPALRVEWNMSPRVARPLSEITAEISQRLSSLRPLGAIAGLCAVLIVVAAPIALLFGQEQLFVLLAIVGYLMAATGAAVLVLKRKALRLTWLDVIPISLMALICLPCSANLARAVASRYHWQLAAIDLAQVIEDPSRSFAIRGELIELIEKTQRILPEESPEYRVLGEQLRRLKEPTG